MVAILNYIYTKTLPPSFDPVPSLRGTPYYVPDSPRPKYNKFPDLQLPRLTPHSAQMQLKSCSLYRILVDFNINGRSLVKKHLHISLRIKGFDDYIAKPIIQEDLFALVAKNLQKFKELKQ